MKDISKEQIVIDKFLSENNFKRKLKINKVLSEKKQFDWEYLMSLKEIISNLSNQHHVNLFNSHVTITVYNGGRGNNILFSKTVNNKDLQIALLECIVEYATWHNVWFTNKFEHCLTGDYNFKIK